MRSAFLILLLSVPLALWAQQNAGPQAAAPAPTGTQLGHPLDPNDVAILTGKSQTTALAAARSPYGAYATPYYGYDTNVPLFGNDLFNHTGANAANLSFFRTFGMFNPRGFLSFGFFPGVGPGLGPGVGPGFGPAVGPGFGAGAPLVVPGRHP